MFQATGLRMRHFPHWRGRSRTADLRESGNVRASDLARRARSSERARIEVARVSGVYRDPSTSANDVLADLMRVVSHQLG